jgi:hypothetical protein
MRASRYALSGIPSKKPVSDWYASAESAPNEMSPDERAS